MIPMLKAGALRHVVNVMRPASVTDEYGQTSGEPTVIMREWPCSITSLSGRELEQARSKYAFVTYQIEGYADPKVEVTPDCFLTGGSLGQRVLHIGFADDVDMVHVVLRLLCDEIKDGNG